VDTNDVALMIEPVVESYGLEPSAHYGLVSANNTGDGTGRGFTVDIREWC